MALAAKKRSLFILWCLLRQYSTKIWVNHGLPYFPFRLACLFKE